MFDVRVAEASSKRSSSSEAIVETDRYFKEKNVERTAYSLDWWKSHHHQYRKLSILAKKYLCVPATSVPSERLFSKAGELVSATCKRNRLKPKYVDMMLVVTKNILLLHIAMKKCLILKIILDSY